MIPRREFIQSTLKTMVAAAPIATMSATTEPQPQFAVYYCPNGSHIGQCLGAAFVVAEEHNIEVRFSFNGHLYKCWPDGTFEHPSSDGVRLPHKSSWPIVSKAYEDAFAVMHGGQAF